MGQFTKLNLDIWFSKKYNQNLSTEYILSQAIHSVDKTTFAKLMGHKICIISKLH